MQCIIFGIFIFLILHFPVSFNNIFVPNYIQTHGFVGVRARGAYVKNDPK